MDITNALVVGAILPASILLTNVVRRYALEQDLIDRPNERSSHSVPTPRGGGLAIVITFLLAQVFFVLYGGLESNAFYALIGGGAVIALIGFLDDRHDLSVPIRLTGQFAAAIWATAWIDGIPSLELGFATLHWGWLGYIISVFGIVWLVNLYNFMDGIDGIASSEAVFVAGFGGILLIADGAESLGWSVLALATASLGFLFWNWPKAKIFMGDVGSAFLGYSLGVFALLSTKQSEVSLWVWLLLLNAFIVDATVTLLRRLKRGAKVGEAHRSHAYQHVTTLLDSHLKVTLGVIGINVLVLAPMAFLAWQLPDLAVPIAVAALFLFAVAALRFGAGVDGDIQDSIPK
ncbi:MAG: glycosyltransferase family 4 protein [Anaerolineaceae bacterium]|nr:glycosyltransferase family 4 protein [Anaerolineaceae bacterium]